MKKPDIEPEVGEVVRSTIVNRVYQGKDKPLAIDVQGTGNVEEALLDITLGQADLAEKILFAAEPDDDNEPEGEGAPSPAEALTDDGD
ncbi:hypothetical protein SEA_LITTLEFELLA_71 [Gordonia phage LittleFella]|nr:hypothetical protein SEA_LITTLEFELLA_71 [Gordonia phage LittleFella]